MMVSRKSNQLEELMPALGNLYRLMATSRDTFLGDFNLSRAQMELLISIKKSTLSTTKLAEEFSISSSAVSQMVDQLIERGLIAKVVSDTDKRVSYITLTEEGKRFFKAMHTCFLSRVEERFQNVSETEIQALLTIVNKITIDVQRMTYGKN